MTDFPPFNALGEPLGGVMCGTTPWYRPIPDDRPCPGCNEPLTTTVKRGFQAIVDEAGDCIGGRWWHDDCLIFARSRRLKGRKISMMAVHESADVWTAVGSLQHTKGDA